MSPRWVLPGIDLYRNLLRGHRIGSAPPCGPNNLPAPITSDGVHPRPESGPVVEARQFLPGSEQNVLNDIFSIYRSRKVITAEPQKPPAPRFDDASISAGISVLSSANVCQDDLVATVTTDSADHD